MPLRKRRRERKLEAFVVASDLPKSPGHPFSTALNRLLAENGFDQLVEKLCAPYAETFGPLGMPPDDSSGGFSGRQMLPSVSQPDRSQIDHSGDRTGEPRSERASAGSATTFSISSKRR